MVAAWAGHTEVSREIAKNLQVAIEQHYGRGGVTAAAIDMGLGREDLSKQLAGVKPLNLLRLGFLPVEVYTIFLALEAQRLGAELLTARDRELVIAAARLGVTRVKAILPGFFRSEHVDHERNV